MSNKESEKGSSSAVESESVTGKATRTIPIGKPGPKCRKMLVEEANEEKPSNTSDGAADPTKSGNVLDELEEIFGGLASSPQKKAELPAKVSTENLLSVLEGDGVEKKTEPEPAPPPPPPPPPPPTLNGSLESKSDVVKPSSKRYVYKLKSKSGKVLRYTSNVPIVLKKPVINLTKMTEIDDCGAKGDEETADDLDSDNSTKENMKGKEAPGDNTPTQIVRKRGRPPLSQKTPASVASTDERNSSEAAAGGDAKDKTPSSSYGVQTRKRQLKFLPDGRILTPTKKTRNEMETVVSSSDSDVEAVSDHESESKNSSKKVDAEKKSTPVIAAAERKPGPAKKKVLDAENSIQEKASSEVREQNEKSSSSLSNSPTKSVESGKNKTASNAPSTSQPSSSSTPAKKVTPVDPAQLLSSLIGVPITPSQLNIVKFKPKVIQERSSNAPTPKKVTIDDEKLRKMTTPGSAGGGSEAFRNTPFKVVSKTTFQKILPKPSPPPPDKVPIMRRVEHRIMPATATPLTYATIAPKISLTSDFTPTIASTTTPNHNDSFSSKFDNFTDSKVVKTKAGPKKMLKRKSTNDSVVGEDSPKTVYDLLQHVFDQMPSWNLHVIPDTSHFCIAQVSRGRMGIPILKKSIELNGEFFAKVYVHQLHCKRYDGIYDTESKILALIREIDALTA